MRGGSGNLLDGGDAGQGVRRERRGREAEAVELTTGWLEMYPATPGQPDSLYRVGLRNGELQPDT